MVISTKLNKKLISQLQAKSTTQLSSCGEISYKEATKHTYNTYTEPKIFQVELLLLVFFVTPPPSSSERKQRCSKEKFCKDETTEDVSGISCVGGGTRKGEKSQ